MTAAQRNPEASRRRILEAAAAEFADHGPAGARIDRIAARAGINKRMIYHYFGGKSALFEAVLDDQWSDAEVDLTPRAIRLAMWEALGDAAAGRRNARTEAWRSRVAARERDQRAGHFPADLDAAVFELMLRALEVFPVVFPQITAMVLGLGPDQVPARLETFRDRLVAVLADHGPRTERDTKPRLRYRWQG